MMGKHNGKPKHSIDLYTKIELAELSIVITLINIAFLFTFRQEQLFHGVCETDQISAFLITHFGIVAIDLFYSLLMIPIFLVIKWFEKVWNINGIGIFILLLIIGIHFFYVYHDYSIYVAGGY